MSKMHELLAVESSVTANFNREVEESTKAFGRGDLFQRVVTVKKHFDEADQRLDTTETKEITTTVRDRLKWFAGPSKKFFDLILQKDSTNQNAKADIEVDGSVIAKDVPATTLLMLESKLQDIRRVLDATPTLPSGILWELDPAENLYRTKEPTVTFSSKKTAKAVVLYEATKEHPAQVKEMFEDVPVAQISKTTYSGMLTSREKAELIGRLDKLLQACKKARQRANNTEVVKSQIGESIFNYLYKDLVS